MSKTYLKKTSFLNSIFLDLQIRSLNQKNRFFSLSWANLGQKAAPGRPERPKMRSKSVPRQPKWDQKASQDSQNEAKMCHRTFTFWWPAVPSFKRGGFQGSAQEAPKRPQEGPKRFQEASKRWFWEILAFILADVWLFLAMLFNHCLSARDERLGWLRNRLIFHFLFFKCCKKNGGFEGPKSIQNRCKSEWFWRSEINTKSMNFR